MRFALQSTAVLAIAAFLVSTGCRTTQASNLAGMKQEGLTVAFDFDKEAEQSLYLKMLQVEAAAGAQVPKDRVHAASGLIACQKQGELESCSFHVRLPADKLSSSQPLDRETATKIWNYARTTRPDLAESKIFANLNCSYMGKKSPPYNVEDVDCRVFHPRVVREAIFEERAAEELAELLRGQSSYGHQLVSLQGALACQQISGSTRRACMVRAVQTGVLSETVREVSAPFAEQVSDGLWRTYHEMLGTEKNNSPQTDRTPVKAPQELVASLTCIIDSTKLLSDGRRRYVCRATL